MTGTRMSASATSRRATGSRRRPDRRVLPCRRSGSRRRSWLPERSQRGVMDGGEVSLKAGVDDPLGHRESQRHPPTRPPRWTTAPSELVKALIKTPRPASPITTTSPFATSSNSFRFLNFSHRESTPKRFVASACFSKKRLSGPQAGGRLALFSPCIPRGVQSLVNRCEFAAFCSPVSEPPSTRMQQQTLNPQVWAYMNFASQASPSESVILSKVAICFVVKGVASRPSDWLFMIWM